ncbi:hypothetical protein QBC39DRAFT_376268 [Podospora conica]|nr:hypothetical protein QBC39DRAFT_376268 [Schizothecium conicum]
MLWRKSTMDAAAPQASGRTAYFLNVQNPANGKGPAAKWRSQAIAIERKKIVELRATGPSPDLGTVSPIPFPLRQVARTWSRRLAATQTVAVVEAGGRTVSLSSILGPEFAAAPALLVGPDQFHPSAAGYESLARLLVPSVLSALGKGEAEEETPRVGRGEAVPPRIDDTEVGGAKRGIGGRWLKPKLVPKNPSTRSIRLTDGHEAALGADLDVEELVGGHGADDGSMTRLPRPVSGLANMASIALLKAPTKMPWSAATNPPSTPSSERL